MSFDPTSVLSGIRSKRRTLHTPEGSVDLHTDKSDHKDHKPGYSQTRTHFSSHPPEPKTNKDDELAKTTINLLAEQLSILQNRVKELEKANGELSRENEALKRDRDHYYSIHRHDTGNGSIPTSLRGSRDGLSLHPGPHQLAGYHSKSHSEVAGKSYGSVNKQSTLKPPASAHPPVSAVFNKKLSSLTIMNKTPLHMSPNTHKSGLSTKNHQSHSSNSVSNGYLGLYNSKSNRQPSQDLQQHKYTSHEQTTAYTSAADQQHKDGYTERPADKQQNGSHDQHLGSRDGAGGRLADSPSEFGMFRWVAAEGEQSANPSEFDPHHGSGSGWQTHMHGSTPMRGNWGDSALNHTVESTPPPSKMRLYDSKTKRAQASEAPLRDLRLEILEQIVRLHPKDPVPHVTIDF